MDTKRSWKEFDLKIEKKTLQTEHSTGTNDSTTGEVRKGKRISPGPQGKATKKQNETPCP
jgi:hypothetical protein